MTILESLIAVFTSLVKYFYRSAATNYVRLFCKEVMESLGL